ncbi:MAG: hypothetical protein II144_03465, partial [Paludibacteraceae bacterium]|nr:hypothetical protein [Paludibacteraceae bacterium]
MKRILYILLLAMGMTALAPVAALVDNRVAAVYAVDAKTKAKQQREREKAKAKKQKEREKAKAKAQKEREKAKAQKQKEQAKAAAQKQKAAAQKQKEKERQNASRAKAQDKNAPQLSAAEEKEAYMSEVAAIDKANARAEAYNTRDISHRLGLWGQIGYSNLFTSGIAYDATAGTGFQNKDKGYVGGGLGLGYQLRYKQMLMTVGAEFNFYNSVMGVQNTEDGTFVRSYGMQPYASTMTYRYSFDPLKDRLIGGFVQVPVLFGMELKNLPLFWQAGLKVGMGVMGQSKISGTMTTSISDSELVGSLTNMYNHTLVTEQDVERPSTNVKFGLNLAASAEIGVNLDRWIDTDARMRVSLFADYGLLNSLSYKAADGAQDIPTQMLVNSNPLDFPTNSALATTSATDAKVHPFLIGAKFAVWFDLPRTE